jgi:very-short-patch-repair endonuclease
LKAGLIVEADGGQHFDADAIEYDAHRTAVLGEKGFRVIRFRSDHILKYPNEIEDQVYNELTKAAGPLPGSTGGGSKKEDDPT